MRKNRDVQPLGDEAAASTTIAKWFIPSATALFVLMGYIVQSAQEDLLGVGAISHSSTSYVESAALFVRDLVSLPLDLLLGDVASLGDHWEALSLAFIVLALLAAFHSFRDALPAWSNWFAPGIVVVIFLVKFFAFDLPLTLVNDIILDRSSEFHHLIDPDNSVPAAAPEGPISGFAVNRAKRFSYLILCSHLGKGVLLSNPNLTQRDAAFGGHDCSQNDDRRRQGPRALFTTLILLQIAMVVASILTLARPERSILVLAIGLLGLSYALSVPYAYGKLLKPTAFDFGTVRLSTGLVADDGVDTGTVHTDVDGLVLSQDANETRLLHVNPLGSQCPNRPNRNQKSVNMLVLAPSEVISIGEIQSRDIFEWSITAVQC